MKEPGCNHPDTIEEFFGWIKFGYSQLEFALLKYAPASRPSVEIELMVYVTHVTAYTFGIAEPPSSLATMSLKDAMSLYQRLLEILETRFCDGKPTQVNDVIMSVREVAERLDKSEGAVHRLVYSGKLRAIENERGHAPVFIRESEVMNYKIQLHEKLVRKAA